jgi:uncharacterized membrane protein YbjE (DUF340 family)
MLKKSITASLILGALISSANAETFKLRIGAGHPVQGIAHVTAVQDFFMPEVNKRLEKLAADKRVNIVVFTTSSLITLDSLEQETSPKKKSQQKSSKSTSSPQQDAAVAELASIVSVPVEHDNDEKTELKAEVQLTENNLSDDDAHVPRLSE